MMHTPHNQAQMAIPALAGILTKILTAVYVGCGGCELELPRDYAGSAVASQVRENGKMVEAVKMTTTLCHRLSALSRIELENLHMTQPLINFGKLHHLLLYKPTCARWSVKPRALLRTVKPYLSLGLLHDLFKFLLCLQLHVRVASISCLRQSTSVH